MNVIDKVKTKPASIAFSPQHWHELPLFASQESRTYDDGCQAVFIGGDDGYQFTPVYREGEGRLFGWMPEVTRP